MTSKSTLSSLAAVVLLFAPASPTFAVTTIVDDFDDGAIGTNTNGTGTGFVKVTNAVGGSGTVAESGTQVLITTSGTNNNTGVVSNDPLTVGLTDTVTVNWDVISASGLRANGIELLVQGTTAFRGVGQNHINLKIRPSGSAEMYVNDVALGVSDATTIGQALDGFTLTLTADASGWSFTSTDYPSLANLSGGYGASDFVTTFNGGRVTATVQGVNGSTMAVGEITATVIPEPSSTFLLAVLGLLGLLRRRR